MSQKNLMGGLIVGNCEDIEESVRDVKKMMIIIIMSLRLENTGLMYSRE